MYFRKFTICIFLLVTSLLLCSTCFAADWDTKDYTAFHTEQIKGENKIKVSTYSTWIGPDTKWPIWTEDPDENWRATVTAYNKNKKPLGTIDVPEEAQGVVDYSSYVSQGIKYIRVTQGSGADSGFIEVVITDRGSDKTQGSKTSTTSKTEKQQKSNSSSSPKTEKQQQSNSSTTPKTAQTQKSDDAAGANTWEIDTVHIIFTKIEGEDYKVRAQCDNGQYGEPWWGVWDIATEGSWASKVYVLDADKKVLGKLTVPESALGVLDYYEYKDQAAYIQVEHPMCVGIYEIATGKTIKGTLDDIITEGNSAEGDSTEGDSTKSDNTSTTFGKYRTIIPAFVGAAIIILNAVLFIRRRRNFNN